MVAKMAALLLITASATLHVVSKASAATTGGVIAWGLNSSGQTNIPSGLGKVLAVAGGGSHSVALKENGTVMAWGGNSVGQTNVPAGLTNVIGIAAGQDFCLAINPNGTVVGWGRNSEGQLNPPAINGVMAVSAGVSHGLALTSQGVWPWGGNAYGQLNIPPGFRDAVAIAAGGYHSLALTSKGTVVGWGWNQNGQISIPPGLDGVIAIAAGASHSLALKGDGTIVAWGDNSAGQTSVPATASNIIAVVAGGYHNLALRKDGNVIGWGTNGQGQLAIPPNLSSPFALGAGSFHSLALTSSLPWILVQPKNQLVLVGDTVSFSVTAGGPSPLKYQWGFNGTNLVSATNSDLTLTNVSLVDAGQFQVVITNNAGSITSSVALLTVLPAPVVRPCIVRQPFSQTVTLGTNVTFSVTASGAGELSYQWSFNSNLLNGATSSALVLTNVQLSDAGSYSVEVSQPSGSIQSAPATLTVVERALYPIDWPDLRFTQVAATSFAYQHNFLTQVTHAGDGTGRLFLVGQFGRIYVLGTTGIVAQPLLDLTDRVLPAPEPGAGEQGLLSIAFPPCYGTKGYFYVNYTRAPDGATVVSRFSVSKTNANVANAASEQVLLTIPQPYPNHNGGQLMFGPDGFLYIGMGDGGSQGDPDNRAQDPASLLGKMLRIDVEGTNNGYIVPSSNPFVGNANYKPEIWAVGLRNPWRFSFDRLTGDLYVGDVGQNLWEEIDFQPGSSTGGENYGWRIKEGTHDYNVPPGYDASTLTPPIVEYGRSLGQSVTGGFVYRGPANSRMQGMYFYADFGSRRIWGLKHDGTNWQNRELATTSHNFSSFGEDEAGRLYGAKYGGSIIRIDDSGLAYAPVFSPGGGVFRTQTMVAVMLTSVTPGVRIHYTTDGSDPSEANQWITSGGNILVSSTLSSNVTIKAKAYRSDLLPSPLVAATYTFMVATPFFAPPAGPITNGTRISISCATPDAIVRYTIDGSEPNESSPVFSVPFAIAGDTTVKAKGFREGFSDSTTRTTFYALVTVATPNLTPPNGPVTNQTVISMTCTTPNAVIHYTIDGSDPQTNSPVYSSPFLINGDTIVKARAFRPEYHDSAIASAQYRLNSPENTVVTTVAGTGAAGFKDGLWSSAQFSSPQGVCVDATGTLYVCDSGNYRIRKISPSGQVITFAGSGAAGLQDGIGTNANFSQPTGICVDPGGTLYVADCNQIRKIGPDATVSTVVNDGGCRNLSFWQVAIDRATNLYSGKFAAIYEFSPDGQNIWGAGNGGVYCGDDWCAGPGPAAGVDAQTNLYVAAGNQIHKFSPTKSESLFAGSFGGYNDGFRTNALFERPWAVASGSSGILYIGEAMRVRMINSTGWVSTLAGTTIGGYLNGPGRYARFNNAAGICVDSLGNVYVADVSNHRIRKIWADSDSDGIPDLLEANGNPFVVGVDDRSVDSDGDGMPNSDEYWAGTDAGSSTSAFRITSFLRDATGGFTLRWASVVGKSYQVQRMSNSTTWQDQGAAIVGDGSVKSFTDTSPLSETDGRFYRIAIVGQ